MSFKRIFLATIAFSILSLSAFAAPYSNSKFVYNQPDGSTFDAFITGDEFFAYQRTKDGFEVVKDKTSSFWCFAKLSDDNKSFVTTTIPVVSKAKSGVNLPASLKGVCIKQQTLPQEIVLEIISERQKNTHRDSKGRFIKTAGTRAPPLEETVGNVLGLCLLVEFPDEPGRLSASSVDDFCNKSMGYTDYGNACSVNEYFKIQSNGLLNYSNIVTAYVKVSKPKSYYDDNVDLNTGGLGPSRLIAEAVEILDGTGFDFSQLSVDEYGNVIAFNIFYAGTVSSGWSAGLWPHTGFSLGISVDGIALNVYQVTDMGSELKIGTFCHENGHMICGFPDLYAYNDNSSEISVFSLMSGGNSTDDGRHPTNIDPYLKLAAGWADVVDLTKDSHLNCMVQSDENKFYRYRKGNEESQYYLMECRSPTGYEGAYGGSSTSVNPATGLVIWQVNELGSNTYSTLFKEHYSPDYEVPYELVVVESKPTSLFDPWILAPGPLSNDGFLNKIGNVFSDNTTPPAKFWSDTGYNVSSNFVLHDVSDFVLSGSAIKFVVGAGTPPVSAPVTTKDLITINAVIECAIPEYSLSFFNSGDEGMNYKVAENSDWLTINRSNGFLAAGKIGELLFNFDTTGMVSGDYSTTVILSALSSEIQTSVIVNLSIVDAPLLELNVTELNRVILSSQLENMSFMISNSGGGRVAYEIINESSYFDLSQSSGTVTSEKDMIYISLNASAIGNTSVSTVLKVKDLESQRVIDLSVTVNIIENSPGLALQPLDNELYESYDKVLLNWYTTSGSVADISLIKSDQLDIVAEIENGITNQSVNNYNWYIPSDLIPDDNYRIRVTIDGTQTVYSEIFTIYSRSSYFAEEEGSNSEFSISAGDSQGYEQSDDSEYVYHLPFDFPFYGESHRDIAISTNGYIYLDPTVGYESFQAGLDYFGGNPTIAPYGADLVTFHGDIYVKEELDKVTISWKAYPFDVYGYDPDYLDPVLWDSVATEFSIVLRPDGVIEFHYDPDLLVYITPLIGISAGDYQRYNFSDFSGTEDMPTSIIWTPQYEVSYTSTLAPERVLRDDDGQSFSSRTVMVKQGSTSDPIQAIEPVGQSFFSGWFGDASSLLDRFRFVVNGPMKVVADYSIPAPNPLVLTKLTFDSVSFEWQNFTGVDGYNIQVSSTSDFSAFETYTSAVNRFTLSGVYFNEIWVRVNAFKESVEGSLTESIQIKLLSDENLSDEFTTFDRLGELGVIGLNSDNMLEYYNKISEFLDSLNFNNLQVIVDAVNRETEISVLTVRNGWTLIGCPFKDNGIILTLRGLSDYLSIFTYNGRYNAHVGPILPHVGYVAFTVLPFGKTQLDILITGEQSVARAGLISEDRGWQLIGKDYFLDFSTEVSYQNCWSWDSEKQVYEPVCTNDLSEVPSCNAIWVWVN